MALISLEEAKNYLRVDTSDDDDLIGTLLQSALRISSDVARLTEEQLSVINSDDDSEQEIYSEDELAKVRELIKSAALYALGYLYEHREEADHHELTITLRAYLFSLREGSIS